jgi:nucleoside-diphosphate-sugar epimerase
LLVELGTQIDYSCSIHERYSFEKDYVQELTMKILVTGASGHVGTVVVAELLGAGHQVVGLARSEQAAERLIRVGAQALRGSLDDMEILSAGAREADGVIHLAFKHDVLFSGNMAGAAEADLEAIKALAKGLEGTGKPLVGVNGTLTLAGMTGTRSHQMTRTEHTAIETDVLPSGPRIDSENFVIGLAANNIRSSVVRLAPTVHGQLDNTSGFIPTIIRIAREKGFAAYVGDGANRWPAVHELDTGRLFRLAVEGAPAGSRLHAVQDEGIAFKDIAGAIGNKLNVSVRGISVDEAQTHFRHLAHFVVVDNPTSSRLTQELLQWEPMQPDLLEDLRLDHYYKDTETKG